MGFGHSRGTKGGLVAGLVGAVIAGSGVASANDSQAAFGIGGLTLTRSQDIRMDSEVLRISRDRISVDYVFTNTSAVDVDTLVAFPLPDVENGIEKLPYDFKGELDFKTTIDGRPAQLDIVEKATFKGRDVTQRLRAAGLPIMPVHETFDPLVNRLAPEVRQGLIADGLIADGGSDGSQTLWDAFWTVSTSVTRRQVFPAGRSVAVSHSYKPFLGGSVGGRFDRTWRREADFAKVRAEHCIDDTFMKGFDKRTKGGAAQTYSEVWIDYVLTSGANWKGPIGDFRMLIDKGNADALVSFCADGVKKVAPTVFEVAKKNFTPTRDVKVLIIDFTR